LNYAVAEFRDYRLRLIREFADNYDFAVSARFYERTSVFQERRGSSGSPAIRKLVRSVRQNP